MDEHCEIFTLGNGIRLVAENIPSMHTVSVGVWIKCGSALETAENNGISHFAEHMLLKYEKSPSCVTFNELESRGGQLNAFTEREFSCFRARVLYEDAKIALKIIGRILSKKPTCQEGFETERLIVLEEIKNNRDSIDQFVLDKICNLYWAGSSLALPITGSESSVGKMTLDQIVDHVDKHYVNSKVIVSIVGKLNVDEVIETVNANFIFPAGENEDTEEYLTGAPLQRVHYEPKKTNQVYFGLGFPGAAYRDLKKVHVLSVLNAVLSGGFTGRFFDRITERLGLTYSITTNRISYLNEGLFIVYARTSLASFEKLVDAIIVELNLLKDGDIQGRNLDEAKNKVISNFYFNNEKLPFRMARLAQSQMYLPETPSTKDVVNLLREVTLDEIVTLATHIFDPSKMTLVAAGPFM